MKLFPVPLSTLGCRHPDTHRSIRSIEVKTASKTLISLKYAGQTLFKDFIRRLLENYCFVLLTNRDPPQISDNRPDMGHRALFVTLFKRQAALLKANNAVCLISGVDLRI